MAYLVTNLVLFLGLPDPDKLEPAMTNNKVSQNDKERRVGNADSNC
jgi:hypothetical protein